MLEILTQPAVEPVTIEDVKFWARLDGTAFDAALPGMISAARAFCEQEIGAKIITQVWREEWLQWPTYAGKSPTAYTGTYTGAGGTYLGAGGQKIHLYPVRSVSVSYWNGTDWVFIDPTMLTLIKDSYGVMFTPNVGFFYPTIGITNGPAVRADFTVGMTSDPAQVPAGIKQFIAAHVAFWARNPEAATERTMVASPYLASLLDSYRTFL